MSKNKFYDKAFRQQLRENPKQALKEAEMSNDNHEYVVHHNTKEITYIVIPGVDLSAGDLQQFQAAKGADLKGVGTASTVGTVGSIGSATSTFSTITSLASASSASTSNLHVNIQ